MTDAEEYTPSLIAGLSRYRLRVLATILAFALLGAVYAMVSWKPEAAITVVVQVSSGVANQNNINPDRATSEVAAQLGSPEVIAAAEASSGVAIDKVTATASQGQSTIAVVVGAGSASDAAGGANALIPAYNQVRATQDNQQIQAQLAVIDASVADIDNSISLVNTQLESVPATSARAAVLQTELDTLAARRNQLRSDRDQAQIAASSSAISVSIGDGPNPASGRVSLLTRYVPAGVVVGLLLSLGVIAVAERRRPWLVDADSAARLMGAPLVAVGSGPGGPGERVFDDVAPVVAMSILRVIGDAPLGVALLLPRGGTEVGDATAHLAEHMVPVFERAGAQVAVLAVTSAGQAFRMVAGSVGDEIPGLWNEFAGRDELEKGFRAAGLDADVVVLVPAPEVDHEVLLDLIVVADAIFVSTETGTDLEPLFALRRDLEALGRRAHGVVVDISVPARL